jgi:hypothetical protein
LRSARRRRKLLRVFRAGGLITPLGDQRRETA